MRISDGSSDLCSSDLGADREALSRAPGSSTSPFQEPGGYPGQTVLIGMNMTDLFSKFDPLIAEREALLATAVRDHFAIVMDQVKSPTLAIINGKETILLGTYNYMGMTFDRDVIQAGRYVLDAFGSATTVSRVLNVADRKRP